MKVKLSGKGCPEIGPEPKNFNVGAASTNDRKGLTSWPS